jgi:hypothetical protein
MMNPLSRRDTFEHVTQSLCAALTSSNLLRDDTKNKGELFAVGPFAMHDWFNNAQKSAPFVGPLSPLTTPNLDDVLKVLKGCQIYIIDKREGDLPARASFPKAGLPIVAIGGQLSGDWQSGENSFTLSIMDVKIKDISIASFENSFYRQIGMMIIKIMLTGRKGQEIAEKIYSFSSERPVAIYDIRGRLRMK